MDRRLQPHLPNHVIDQILLLILTKPTKSAVRMSFLSKQWEGIWSSVPVLDFDEGEPHDDDDEEDHKLQHTKFINFVNRCLEFREKVDKQVVLDKFKLHMMRYDDTRIDKWLSFAFHRSVKELDISFGTKNDCHKYCLSLQALVNAKSITSLKLESVVLEDLAAADHEPISLSLPSLKTVSLKTVQCGSFAFRSFISGCPSIEYLSLTSCSFHRTRRSPWLTVFNSSLKSLHFMHCHCQGELVLGVEAMNLESFTYVSGHVDYLYLLRACCNLKYINIQAEHLIQLLLCQLIQDDIEVTINTPNLEHVLFIGSFKSNLSLEAPNLLNASITLPFGREQPTIKYWSWEHFCTLTDFLKKFGTCKLIQFSVVDAEALIFPENFRKTFSPPLPSLKELCVYFKPSDWSKVKDRSGLRNSLLWMAPSAEIDLPH